MDPQPTPTREPEGRTIELAGLPESLMRELTTVLSPRGGAALLASPDRFVSRERVILALVPIGLFFASALAASRLAFACAPRQEASWALLYALPLLPVALAIVRAIAWAARARRMPFAPGVYVLDRDVVIAHGPRVRIVPLAKVAGIGAPRRALGGAEITLWIEGEGSETCRVPPASGEAIAESLEQARERALAEPAAGRRTRDALAELKRSAAWDRASAERPRSDLPASIGAAVPIACALGIATLLVRNAASDALAVSRAIAASDVEALACYVEAGGAEADAVRARVLPETALRLAEAAGTSAALGAYVEAYPEAPGTAEARTRWIAMEYASARGSSWSLRAFLARFPDAPQAAEARAALPRLALEEAIRADEVDAYTYVIHEHGGTREAEDARTRRHARYERALAALLARGGSAQAAAFLRELFAYLEGHDGPEVLVRFRTPDDAELERFDAAVQVIGAEDDLSIVPIAPSFRPRLSQQREALVYDRLQRALAGLVPRDVLPLARGAQLPHPLTDEEMTERLERVPEDEREAERARLLERIESDTGQPEIRIDYAIVPSGGLYVSALDPLDAIDALLPDREPERRAFAGFRIEYAIEMRIPGRDERHTMAVEVEPPSEFSVDGGGDRPSSATIYEVMATRAFDRLGEELTRAFVGDPEAPPGDPAAREE